ncbi:MAG TPA: shikimate dehydrogenase [Pirellulales bacterium]|nr:shikimate dehydrogenase [Pirellulales bacterium]
MICVTIGRRTVSEMVGEQRRLAAAGAQLCEFRLDHLEPPIDMAELFAKRDGPVVITFRRPEDGGVRQVDESYRRRLLKDAMQAGAEYVDLEEDAAAAIPRVGSARRIVSLHDFTSTPSDLSAIHARLASRDADLVKIAARANTTHDVTRVLRLVRTAGLPTVAFCMGELGTPSRLLAGRCGAPFTYACAATGEALAPGQLSFSELVELYHYDQIGPRTELYGVIGDPIAHSRSPLVHNAAFRSLGLDKVYLPFRVPADDLGRFLADAPELELQALSVTIPHKEAVLAAVTDPDDAVREIGAANTLVWGHDRLYGFNTDQAAAIDSLAAAIESAPEATAPLAGLRALVLGAGGAAKAIVHGLLAAGAEVLVSSRTFARAEQISAAIGGRALAWEMRYEPRVDVLVNCTPLGMSPHVQATPFDGQYLLPGMIVFDTVYNPETTLLVEEARRQRCTVITGVEMFVRQAARQFRHFTGMGPPLELMRQTLRANAE